MRELLSGHAAALPLRPKSAVLERYDLCFDLVGRHGSIERPAFRWQDRNDVWQELSYGQLNELSACRAAEWSAHGVEEGQTLCVILSFGPEWVIAALSAIRLGCVLSFLPPAGARFHALRLEALAPEHIVTTPLAASSLGEARALVIPPDLPPLPPRRESCVLPSGAPFARLFSPLAPEPHLPLELSVDDAYCAALRDGLLAHGLQPGRTFAAPGADFLQYQPSLLFSTLLLGATYVHVELESVAKSPAAFAALELDTVGVLPRLRDLLLEAGLEVGKRWGYWWRGVNEESKYQRWHRFTLAAGLQRVPSSNILVDSSAGGALFFSARRRSKHGGMSYLVLPSAGTGWGLAPPGAPSAEGAPECGEGEGFGVFGPRSLVGLPWPCAHLLQRQEAEWLYAGVSWPAREGRVYPAAEVLACLSGLEFAEGTTVVAHATSDASQPHSFQLLIFVGRARAAELKAAGDAWRRGILGIIDNELSPDCRPDRIEFFALSPRRVEGETDHEWCAELHARGLLRDRESRESYALIDELRDFARALAGASQSPAGGAE